MYCVSFCNVTGWTAITEQCYACLGFGIAVRKGWPTLLALDHVICPYVQNIGERFVRTTGPHVLYQIKSLLGWGIFSHFGCYIVLGLQLTISRPSENQQLFYN